MIELFELTRLSTRHTLVDALVAVGYQKDQGTNFSNNYSLQGAITDLSRRPYIALGGFYFNGSSTTTTDSEQLIDATAIHFSTEPETPVKVYYIINK